MLQGEILFEDRQTIRPTTRPTIHPTPQPSYRCFLSKHKNLTELFDHISAKQAPKENQGVFLKALSMLIFKKCFTLFVAYKLNEILHKL